MSITKTALKRFLHFFVLFLSFFQSIAAEHVHFHSTASLSTSWTATAVHGSPYTPIILNTARNPFIGFGFVRSTIPESLLSTESCSLFSDYGDVCVQEYGFVSRTYPDNYQHPDESGFFLAIFATERIEGTNNTRRRGRNIPRINLTVLWSVNRDNTVKENATVEFDSNGDLILKDADGTSVWSTNTSGKSIVGMRITETGHLLLHDTNNKTVWSSFDQPMTDTWLPQQTLLQGQRITARISPNNMASGVFYLSVDGDGFYAYILADPPQVYSTLFQDGHGDILFVTASGDFKLNFWNNSVNYSTGFQDKFQYLRLDSDGHLRVYFWDGMSIPVDVLNGDECAYPTVCGEYGICSNWECSCPISADGDPRYFTQINQIRPSLGCTEKTMLSCNSTALNFLELEDVSYFNVANVMVNTDVENCKRACLKNCSCKAVVYHYFENASTGTCTLPSHIFSLMANKEDKHGYKATTFLKVQSPPPALSPKSSTGLILGTLFGAIFVVILIVIICAMIFRLIKQKAEKVNDPFDEEYFLLEEASEVLRKFSYEELKSATRNFQKRIGGGGFGSVYEGILGDGTIAVKRLDDLGHGQRRKEFLAEVNVGNV